MSGAVVGIVVSGRRHRSRYATLVGLVLSRKPNLRLAGAGAHENR